jgi:tRNA 2-selenouridine synthase
MPSEPSRADNAAHIVNPFELGIQDFSAYALVIDARSPREYAEDHIPDAVNLPVVGDDEYAVVGTTHRSDTHRAYLIGVEHSLRNMADHIASLISRYGRDDRMLVYCFRGGKRSKLWADTLRTIGFKVDVLAGGWKNYRRWVRAGLDRLPLAFDYRVLCGSTGCGKTRLLAALADEGAQTIDLEDVAGHRGSLIGGLPGTAQPSQKLFDSLLLERMRQLDPSRPVWIEAESKRIGKVQIPEILHRSMHAGAIIRVEAPMTERVKLWREDYRHFADDPSMMVEMLEPLKPLIGGDELKVWQALAASRQVDALFERVMVNHYDPAYRRSSSRNFASFDAAEIVVLDSLQPDDLRTTARRLIADAEATTSTYALE